MNDDARSPGSGSTPGPLSQQPPSGLDTSDPGELIYIFCCLPNLFPGGKQLLNFYSYSYINDHQTKRNFGKTFNNDINNIF